MSSIAKLRDTMWQRHANPLSGWSRVGLGVLLVVALWSHAWLFIGIVALAILTNPWWFPPPQQLMDNFMFHVVVGERIWLNETKRWVKFATSVGGLVVFLLMVYALWVHNVGLSVLFLAIIVVWKGLFVRHTRIYQERQAIPGWKGLGSASDADRLRQHLTGANMIAMPDVGCLSKREDPERFKEMLSALHAAISFISKACAIYTR